MGEGVFLAKNKKVGRSDWLSLAFMLICLLILRLFVTQTYAQTGTCADGACTAKKEVNADWNRLNAPPNRIEAASVGNGDFEGGANGMWIEYSAQGYYPLIVSSTILPVTPHSGDWAVWLGGAYDEASSISQTVAITTGESTLSYWQWIASAESGCTYDFGQVPWASSGDFIHHY